MEVTHSLGCAKSDNKQNITPSSASLMIFTCSSSLANEKWAEMKNGWKKSVGKIVMVVRPLKFQCFLFSIP